MLREGEGGWEKDRGRERILQIPDQSDACVAAVITFLWGCTAWVGARSDSMAMWFHTCLDWWNSCHPRVTSASFLLLFQSRAWSGSEDQELLPADERSKGLPATQIPLSHICYQVWRTETFILQQTNHPGLSEESVTLVNDLRESEKLFGTRICGTAFKKCGSLTIRRVQLSITSNGQPWSECCACMVLNLYTGTE